MTAVLELATEDLIDKLWICLATGHFHDLPDEES